MKTLGVADRFNSDCAPSRYLPFLMHMEPRALTFYCQADYAASYPDDIRAMRDRGIKVEIDAYQGLAEHDYLLFDDSSSLMALQESRGERPVQENGIGQTLGLAKPEAKRIVYSHSVDDGPGEHSLPPGSFALHPYEWSFYKNTGDGLYLKDENDQVAVSRSSAGNERVVVGLTHFAGYKVPPGPEERRAYKDELARKMGVSFNPDLPLLVFTYAPMDADEANAGVARLAERANVVVKMFPNHAYLGRFDRALDVRGPNIFMTTDHSLNALMRLAADLNLTSFVSSAFVSCVAHKLRTVAVCTQRMSSAYPRGIFSYVYYFSFQDRAYARLARSIGPINIGHTEKIFERLNDEEYWRRYDELLPGLLKSIFGGYLTGDEAAAYGARRIEDVLRYDSFVTPELRRLGRIYKGRPELNLGDAVDL